MEAFEMSASTTMQALVGMAHEVDEPVVVLNGEEECLVAMRPAVFERILFDTNLLNCEDRESIWL